MNVKIKQNKNTPAVRVASAALAAFVLFFSLCVPSFAYTDTSTNGVEFSPLPVLSSGDTSSMVDAGSYPWAYGRSEHLYCSAKSSANNPNPTVYAFTYQVNTSYYLIMCSADCQPWSYYFSRYDNYGTATYSSGNVTADFSTVIYTYSDPYDFSATPTLTNQLPHFSSLAAGKAAFQDFIENPPVVVTPHSLNTSLPAGNAIIIDVTGNNAEALSLSTSSALRHKDNWSDGNQMMGYFASAPTSLSSPFDGTHSITWRGVGSPNLFGGYNTWNTTAPLLPTGNFLVIVNPAYPNDNPDSITSNQASNGAISISCGYCLSAQIVPLSSSWVDGSIVSSSGDLRLNGEYDPSTDSWSFNNSVTGQPQNPVSGGLTDVDAEHITINDWLQNISHQIGSFFSGAIGAVSTLVSAGSDFIHSLSGLYAWLPAPVFSVLSAALILVITIGVIKVFI